MKQIKASILKCHYSIIYLQMLMFAFHQIDYILIIQSFACFPFPTGLLLEVKAHSRKRIQNSERHVQYAICTNCITDTDSRSATATIHYKLYIYYTYNLQLNHINGPIFINDLTNRRQESIQCID